MKTMLIPIGNSGGIRIPKPIIGKIVRARTILFHAPRTPRNAWKESFEKMARLGDDKLLDPQ